jgi:hypothetical protein
VRLSPHATPAAATLCPESDHEAPLLHVTHRPDHVSCASDGHEVIQHVLHGMMPGLVIQRGVTS